ncbi:hypothetical protein BC830DRAFT_355361 [Chytriomyces sp. MP71]|nr:hypothetical protein BC830DRAFT_355361 [Chytriomyces sp. MP71]
MQTTKSPSNALFRRLRTDHDCKAANSFGNGPLKLSSAIFFYSAQKVARVVQFRRRCGHEAYIRSRRQWKESRALTAIQSQVADAEARKIHYQRLTCPFQAPFGLRSAFKFRMDCCESRGGVNSHRISRWFESLVSAYAIWNACGATNHAASQLSSRRLSVIDLGLRPNRAIAWLAPF